MECRDIATQGITAEELQDAKDFMKGNLALSLESVEVRMGQLAKDEITFRRSFGFGEVVDYINRVTMDDFMRISERIFGGRKLSVVSVGTLNDMKIPQSCIVF